MNKWTFSGTWMHVATVVEKEGLRWRFLRTSRMERTPGNEPILSTETFQVYPNLISIWLKEIQSTRYSVYCVWFVIWRSQHGIEMCEARWQFPYSVYDILSLPHSLSCLQIVLPFVYSEKMFGSIRRFSSQTTILFCCLPEKVLLS